MLKFLLLLGFSVCVLLCDAVEYEDLVENINKNLDYLDKVDALGQNASLIIARGIGELEMLKTTVPNIKEERLETINNIIKRLEQRVEKGIDKNIKEGILIEPKTWSSSRSHKFIKGKIPEAESLNDTLQQIYVQSLPTEISKKCVQNLIEQNKISVTPRPCEMECGDTMLNDTLDSDFPIDEKINYLTLIDALHCTNFSPKQRLQLATNLCKQVRKQVFTMYERRYEPEFADLRFYYLQKIFSCGSLGFSEFYEDEYLSEMSGSINQDGSVGTKDYSPDDKVVTTAQVLTILASALRMMEEGIKT